MLARFARETDMDVFLCAGRYTLLDQSALPELLPACEARGISLVIGGLLNSGILADPTPGARFDYEEAPAELLARAQGIRDRLPSDTTCRCSRRRCSSRWPIPGWRRSWPASGRPPISMTTPPGCGCPSPTPSGPTFGPSGLIADAAPVPSAAG